MQSKYSRLIAGGLVLGLVAGLTIGNPRAEPRTTIQVPENWVVTEAPETARIETPREQPEDRGAHIPVRELIERFEAEYGADIIKIELDRRTAHDVYQIKLKDAQGEERRIEVDAHSGKILHGAPVAGVATDARTHQGHIPMQEIIKRFEQEYNGRVIEIEFEQEDTHDEYEIELIDAQGVKWEIDVDAHSGEVLKKKRDKRVAATPESQIFEGHIPMQEIINRLEAEFNGRVVEIELERESYNDEYEVELIDAQGVKWKIDVDAHSGDILKRKRD